MPYENAVILKSTILPFNYIVGRLFEIRTTELDLEFIPQVTYSKGLQTLQRAKGIETFNIHRISNSKCSLGKFLVSNFF